MTTPDNRLRFKHSSPFAVVPCNLLEDGSTDEILLYLWLDRLGKESPGVDLSNANLAERLRMNRPRLDAAFLRLINRGYLTIETGLDGRTDSHLWMEARN